MTLTLRVEPVLFSLLVGVVDVPGERCWRRRGGRRWNRRLVLRCRSREMMPDDRRFAHPFFKRFLPGQRDQRRGEDNFDQEAHFDYPPRRIRPLANWLSVIGY